MTSSQPWTGGNGLVGNQEPYYTNDDVAILHDIVVRAQELLPSLSPRERIPTNALFNAYYAILPTIGIDADHDSRYARVLFKIGGMPGSDHLYGKFETVLSRMGIEIQFDQESVNEVVEPSFSNSIPRFLVDDHQQQRQPPAERRVHTDRTRRNSESTIWDLTANDGPPPRHSQQLQQNGIPPRVRSNSLTDIWNAKSFEHHISNFRNQRYASRADHARAEHVRTWMSNNAEVGLEDDHGPAITAVDHDDKNSSILELDLDDPSKDHVLLQKFMLLKQHYLISTLRSRLRRWRGVASHLHEDNSNLALLAEYRDRQILFRQAFDTWRTSAQERREHAETEGFFEQLDERASRARDSFLLAKAFTHWAQTVADEIERTSLARKHILRYRFFNSWREITAVNELKVRRQICRKFFLVWRKSFSILHSDTRRALVVYQTDLVRSKFWTWFWQFWTQRVTYLIGQRRKHLILRQWCGRVHASQHDGLVAQHSRQILLRRHTLSIWKTSHQRMRDLHGSSQSHALHAVMLSTFSRWRNSVSLLAAQQHFRENASTNLLQACLKQWKNLAMQDRKAARMDRLKILHEALNIWKDQRRVQVVHHMIDQRIIAQTLYRWVVKERSILEERLQSFRLKRTVLTIMRARSVRSSAVERHFEERAQTILGRKLCLKAFSHWRMQAHFQDELSVSATKLSMPRSVSSVIWAWKDARHRCEELETWAVDADFFFAAGRALRRWKASLETSKQEKRKAAYTHLRRRQKLGIAQKTIQLWRQKAAIFEVHKAQCSLFLDDHDVLKSLNAFYRWRVWAQEITELNLAQQETTARKHFLTWRFVVSRISTLKHDASVISENRNRSKRLKEWSMYHLQLSAREYLVVQLTEKHTRKIIRKMLQHWQQRTSIHTESAAKHSNVDSGFDDTHQAERWSRFGSDLNVEELLSPAGLTSPEVLVAIPAYLQTPSKHNRSGRITARLDSTTPRGPLPTPFEKRLRAHYASPYRKQSFRSGDNMSKEFPG